MHTHIQTGDRVKDTITGYTGIVVGITYYIHGCRRIGVMSQKLSADGKPCEPVWLDEPQLVMLKRKAVNPFKGDTGGPLPFTPQRQSNPTR